MGKKTLKHVLVDRVLGLRPRAMIATLPNPDSQIGQKFSMVGDTGAEEQIANDLANKRIVAQREPLAPVTLENAAE